MGRTPFQERMNLLPDEIVPNTGFSDTLTQRAKKVKVKNSRRRTLERAAYDLDEIQKLSDESSGYYQTGKSGVWIGGLGHFAPTVRSNGEHGQYVGRLKESPGFELYRAAFWEDTV